MIPTLKSSRRYFKFKLTSFQRAVIVSALGITIGGLTVLYATIQVVGYILTGGFK